MTSPERATSPGDRGIKWSLDLPEQITMLPDLVPVYQKAFAGEPWYEVSKCGCARGFSAQRVGESCEKCGTVLTEEAYPTDQLVTSLTELLRSHQPSFLYVERNDQNEPVVGAIAWRASPQEIYQKKYQGRENEALRERLSGLGAEIIWLDEVFADRDKSPKGNLWNFKEMCEQMIAALGEGNKVMAFRTINQALVAKAKKVFGDQCFVESFNDPGVSEGQSALVIIDLRESVAE